MIINKIEPQGFCGGVKRAIDIATKVVNDTSTLRPIYMLGSLIHNEHIINEFKNKGVIVLDDKLSKEEMVSSISSGTVIISAHGISPTIYNMAKTKGLNIIDTTCPYVELVHKNITNAIKDDKEIIYIGTNNHPEVKGVLGISDKIHLVTNELDIKNLKLNTLNPYVTNQTTLSIYDINDYYDLIKSIYPNAYLDNKICNATTERQKAVIEQKPTDLCIIVGDKKSSNTKKLVSVSESAGIKTILIDSVNDLKDYKLDNINTISISSGASTPSYLVDEIINYLKVKA